MKDKEIKITAQILRYCGFNVRADYTSGVIKAFGYSADEVAEMNKINKVNFIVKA